jgi:hypothetical protein
VSTLGPDGRKREHFLSKEIRNAQVISETAAKAADQAVGPEAVG